MRVALLLQRAWLGRGPLARLLLPLAGLYGLLAALSRARYRLGLAKPVRLPVPVLVVGNLVAGGAGKTPTTIALVHLLRERGHLPGIVSRGYGRSSTQTALVTSASTPDEVGDEPLLMHRRTGAPVAVGADRIAAATALLRQHPEVDLVISDDGLQHLRLARDAQVVVFDERGAGNGWLLPAGPLREPFTAAPPGRSVVLYNAPAPSTPWPGHLARRSLAGVVGLREWHAGEAIDHRTIASLRGTPLVAAAGLAHPQRFFDMLRAQGLQIEELALPDHHAFRPLPWPGETPDVVVTEKDAIKLDPASLGSTRVWVATLDFALDQAFAAELTRWLPPRSPLPEH